MLAAMGSQCTLEAWETTLRTEHLVTCSHNLLPLRRYTPRGALVGGVMCHTPPLVNPVPAETGLEEEPMLTGDRTLGQMSCHLYPSTQCQWLTGAN